MSGTPNLLLSPTEVAALAISDFVGMLGADESPLQRMSSVLAEVAIEGIRNHGYIFVANRHSNFEE